MEPGDPTRAAGRFFALGPPVMSVADRLRLGLPTILVLVGFALAGRFLDGLVIGLGTYTVLFGAIPGRRHRALVMAVAGIGLVTAVCAGILAAGSLPWTLTAFLAAAVLAVVLDTAVRLGPPGPYFFLLMVGGGGVVGPPTWVAFVAMGVLLWATMSLAPRNYGLACVAITLLALLMTQALLPGEPPARMALDRVADTLVGAVVAVACLLLIRPRRAATETDRSDRR